MTTKKKSETMQFLETLTVGPHTIGEQLRALRKSDDQTQEIFAKTLEISKQLVETKAGAMLYYSN